MYKGVIYQSFQLPFIYLEMLNFMSAKPERTKVDSAYPPTDYEFASFQFNDLAIKSKFDVNCLNELIKRVSSMLYHYALRFCHENRYCEFSETFQTLLDAVRDAVRLFDPDLGPFENLMRKTLHNALVYHDKATGMEFYRRRKIFEMKLSEARQYNTLHDSEQVTDEYLSENAKLNIDFEDYRKLLVPRDRMILDMYLNGFTIRDIQQKTDLALSSIQSIIQGMVQELQAREKRRLI